MNNRKNILYVKYIIYLMSTTTNIPSMQGLMTYQIGGIPVLAYLGIGITTICLAAVTLYESSQNSNSQNEPKSFLYELPGEVIDTIKGYNPKSSEIRGGKKKKCSLKKKKKAN
jgi:hypothetical protein